MGSYPNGHAFDSRLCNQIITEYISWRCRQPPTRLIYVLVVARSNHKSQGSNLLYNWKIQAHEPSFGNINQPKSRLGNSVSLARQSIVHTLAGLLLTLQNIEPHVGGLIGTES